MLFLLDSNAFSDLMRKHPKVESRLAALEPEDKVVTCPIVRGEILYGIERLPEGRRRVELAKQAGPLFESIRCEPIPPQRYNLLSFLVARDIGHRDADSSVGAAVNALLVLRLAGFQLSITGRFWVSTEGTASMCCCGD